ncbi:hypothetical protein ACFL35_17240, partial [Candidatus Riflebacteria bacterium]
KYAWFSLEKGIEKSFFPKNLLTECKILIKHKKQLGSGVQTFIDLNQNKLLITIPALYRARSWRHSYIDIKDSNPAENKSLDNYLTIIVPLEKETTLVSGYYQTYLLYLKVIVGLVLISYLYYLTASFISINTKLIFFIIIILLIALIYLIIQNQQIENSTPEKYKEKQVKMLEHMKLEILDIATIKEQLLGLCRALRDDREWSENAVDEAERIKTELKKYPIFKNVFVVSSFVKSSKETLFYCNYFKEPDGL